MFHYRSGVAHDHCVAAVDILLGKGKESSSNGSVLFLLCLGLLGEIRFRGGWVGLEHPADRGREPFPSFFATAEVAWFKQFCQLKYWVVDQCRFGASSKKPTGLLLAWNSGSIVWFCNHKFGHAPLIGLDAQGHFCTTPAAKYPEFLCQELAGLFTQQCQHASHAGYIFPHKPFKPIADCLMTDPWSGRRYVSFPWPQPSPTFLTRELEGINGREVPRSSQRPQQ